MAFLAVVIEAVIALKEMNVITCSLPWLVKHLLRDPKRSRSKAFVPAAYQHLVKALKDGLANGSLVKALGGGRDRRGRERSRSDPVGRLLRLLLVSARASRKFKRPPAKSNSTRKGKIAASRRNNKLPPSGAISGLVEVMKALGGAGRDTATRSRAAYSKTSPAARMRKPAAASPRTAVGVATAAKKKSTAAVAKKKKNKGERERALAAKNEGVIRKPRKTVAAAGKKRSRTKKGAGVVAPKSRGKRTAARKR